MDLTESPNYRPVWRTNGAGLPGYGSGWFGLANGDQALIFVTDKRRVVYLPTREGYSLLLSVQEPDKFWRPYDRWVHNYWAGCANLI